MFQLTPSAPQIPAEALELLSQVETATIGHFRYMGFSTGLSSVGPARRVVGTAVTLALPGSDSLILRQNRGAPRQAAMLRGELKIAEASGATRKIREAMARG